MARGIAGRLFGEFSEGKVFLILRAIAGENESQSAEFSNRAPVKSFFRNTTRCHLVALHVVILRLEAVVRDCAPPIASSPLLPPRRNAALSVSESEKGSSADADMPAIAGIL